MRVLLALIMSASVSAAADGDLLATAKTVFSSMTTETLPNGLQVVLLPMPDSPTVTAMAAYRVGSGDEAKDQTGLSHYLEHLLFKGTDTKMPGDIDRLTQKNGGTNNAYTNEDMTVYFFNFAADRWMTALEIEADRMRNTRIDDKHEFQQEKGAVIAELKMYEDQPWDLEYKALLPRLFGKNDPYFHPVIGQEEHVRGATAEIITRYYDAWYHPNNATLIVVGGFDPAEAMAKIKSLFGGIPRADLPARNPTPAPMKREQQIRHEFESKFDVPRMLAGFNGVVSGDADDYALTVIAELLSGGKTSRLYRMLVDKEQLCSAVNADNSAGRYPGWFSVSLEMLAGKDRARAERLMFDEIKRLANEPVPEAELAKVRRAILARQIFSRERVHSLANQIAQAVMRNDLDHLTGYLDRIMTVSPEDVQRAAKRWLVENGSVVVWSLPKEAGDGAKSEPSLARGDRQRHAGAAGGGGSARLEDTKRMVLPNGITLLLLENHRLPLIVAAASVRDARLREPADKAGVAALVGAMLDEGTTTRSNEEIADAIEAVGGSLSFSSGGGRVQVLAPDAELGLTLLLDGLMRPSFAQDRLDAIREQILAEIAAEEAQPRRRGAQRFAALVYGDHPYGRPSNGTKAVVEALSREDCLAFHKAVYVPNNLTLAIVGDFQTDEMVKLIERLTAGWAKADLPPLAVAAPPLRDAPLEEILTDASAAQTHIFIGHLGIRRNDPDYYALEVMDNVLGVGAGFTDRLSATLRDRQGLAYTVRASIASSAGEQPGSFTGYIGTFPDKYTWVREGFLKEIHRIRDEPPTDEEVENAKQFLLGSLAFQFETAGQLSGQMLAAERLGLGFDWVGQFKAKVTAVTPAEVQAAAKKHLDPGRMIVVAVGPIDAEGKPLKSGEKGDRR